MTSGAASLLAVSVLTATPGASIAPAWGESSIRGGVGRFRERVPRRIHYVEPEYPPDAEGKGQEGSLSLRVWVDGDGRVLAVQWISGIRAPFESAAVASILQWRYAPSGERRSFPISVGFRLANKKLRATPTAALLERARAEDPRDRSDARGELIHRGWTILPQLIEELGPRDVERRCSASQFVAALEADGRPALPQLISLFREQSSRVVPTRFCEGLGRALNLVDPTAHEAELRRSLRRGDQRACRLLLGGVQFDGEVPVSVVAALDLDDCREQAIETLTAADDRRVVPHLLQAMTSPSVAVRRVAARSLERILSSRSSVAGERTPEAKRRGAADVLATLVAALADPDAEVRASAGYALGNVGVGASATVPALASALQDPDLRVRTSAVHGLRMMGPWARAAGPALLRARESLSSSAGTVHDDTRFAEALEAAIVAVGARKDAAQIDEEEEIQAAVIAEVVGSWRKDGRTVNEVRARVCNGPVSEGVIRRLVEMGLGLDLSGKSDWVIDLAEVVRTDGSEASVETVSGRGGGGIFSGGGTRFVLRRVEGRWTVVRSYPGVIS